MNIVIDISPLVSSPYTGVSRIIKNLDKELKERENIVVLRIAITAREHFKKLKIDNPRIRGIALPAKIAKQAPKIIQKIGIPINIFFKNVDAYINFAWICLQCKNGVNISVIPDVTPIAYQKWHSELNIQLFTQRVRNIEKFADIVISISSSTKKEIIEKTKIPKEKIVVAYPGLSKEFKTKPSKKRQLEINKKYKLPESYLLFVGTQEPRKNLKSLIKAFSKVNKKIKNNTKLVLVGQKGWGEEVEKPAFVEELGYIPDADLPSVYALAKGLLFPSFMEGFGFPIIEAFSMETPVLTSNRSSMKEVAGEAAILVDPYSVEDISRGLTELINLDTKKRKLLIASGKKEIKKIQL